MSDEDTGAYLAASALVDHQHADVVGTAQRLTQGASSQVERAVALHDFVRDEIRFGWTAAFSRDTASEVLSARLGFCHSKTTLFVALLRCIGIPARIHVVAIDRDILKGLIRPPAQYIDHSYAQVLLDDRWVGTDSYVVDAALHKRATARCRAEGRTVGYGVHVNGSTRWDGKNEAFAQFLNDGSAPTLSNESFGHFADLAHFEASGRGRNPSHLPARLFIRWLTMAANRRVARLRECSQR